MNPFGSFLIIHFEAGGHTQNLVWQKTFWPVAVNLVALADSFDANLTLQFNPQWAEYILNDENRYILLKEWQKRGHEVSLHHHGYDHRDWDGFTNRPNKKNHRGFRGDIESLMKLMGLLAHPFQVVSGTISDERFDYPSRIQYDTEGIEIQHARRKPQRVCLGGNSVIQVGMAFLSSAGRINDFQSEYIKSHRDEVFGVVTHERTSQKIQ